jgi:hypothetical protein
LGLGLGQWVNRPKDFIFFFLSSFFSFLLFLLSFFFSSFPVPISFFDFSSFLSLIFFFLSLTSFFFSQQPSFFDFSSFLSLISHLSLFLAFLFHSSRAPLFLLFCNSPHLLLFFFFFYSFFAAPMLFLCIFFFHKTWAAAPSLISFLFFFPQLLLFFSSWNSKGCSVHKGVAARAVWEGAAARATEDKEQRGELHLAVAVLGRFGDSGIRRCGAGLMAGHGLECFGLN